MADADVVVVGSGAGGGAAAYALTRAGLRVTVLEKGRQHTSTDFTHDEVGTLRRDFFVPSIADEPHTIVKQGRPAERTRDGWISCCVGGGTVHMSGFFFRMHREDMKLRSRFGSIAGGDIADWPIEWKQLEPFYEEVETIIGISGDATSNPFEPHRAPYPMGPLLAHPSSTLIEDACRRLSLHPFPTPRAILSADYQGRSACRYCGHCGGYGCEVGAKSSTLVSFLAHAQATRRLTLIPRAMATRVLTNPDGSARGVLYLDERGAMHEESARVVILACSAIETARLLLMSELGNSSGLVGRHLMFASYTGGRGRFPASSPHFPDAARALPFLDRSVQDHYTSVNAGLPHPKCGTLIFSLPWPSPILHAERLAHPTADGPPLFGSALTRRWKEYFLETRTIEWEGIGEFIPNESTRITLDPEVKDRFGLPVARIGLGIHPATLAASDHLARSADEIMDSAGATARETDTEDRAYTVLQAGTARMGRNRTTSVVDENCQSHDVRNLYVADASSFPSSSGAPFTQTIMANALRVAGQIAARGRAGSL